MISLDNFTVSMAPISGASFATTSINSLATSSVMSDDFAPFFTAAVTLLIVSSPYLARAFTISAASGLFFNIFNAFLFVLSDIPVTEPIDVNAFLRVAE